MDVWIDGRKKTGTTDMRDTEDIEETQESMERALSPPATI
jgi:hypothetical protein